MVRTAVIDRMLASIPAIVVIGALALASVPIAHAQSGLAVKVQPSMIEEQLDPGAVAQGEIQVTNQSGGRQTYSLETRNITDMTTEGRPQFSDADSDDELEAAAWIQPLQDTITLEEGEAVRVPYQIIVPANASPGSYAAAIFVTRSAEAVTDSGAGVGFHVASIFNIRVNGEAQEGLLVREFFTNNLIYGTPDVTFTTRVENTGTVHQRPGGFVSIADMLGNEVGQVTVNETGGGVMPRAERVYTSSWNTDSFVLGRYTAQLSIVYGESTKSTITREVTFWVFPVRELAYAIGGFLVLMGLSVLAIRAYVRRALKRAGLNASPEKVRARAQSLSQRMFKTVGTLILIILVLFIGMIVFFA